MESLMRSLNYQLPQDLHFDKYAQKILENSHTPNLDDTTTIALDSAPSITTFESSDSGLSHQTTTSEFLQKLGATFLQSIQLQSLPKSNNLESSYLPSVHAIPSASIGSTMDLELGPHQLIMDSTMSSNEELQNQLNYDKFMNGIWIGVVLALILISMIFCFCSCFLYHQFRTWKRNYRTTVTQSNDVEAVKINLDLEDPVPEYTLVSGLPSYDAALELLQKNPKSCLIVHPSVFEVFNRNEKTLRENKTSHTEITSSSEASEPLINDNKQPTLPSYAEATTPTTPSPQVVAPTLNHNHSFSSLLTLTLPKTQSKSKTSTASTPTTTTSPSDHEKQFKL